MEGKEDGGERSARGGSSSQPPGQRGVIGPTLNQNIRSRVGQATTRQRDWQATLKSLETTLEDEMHLNVPISIPARSMFPGTMCALGCQV